MLKYRPEVDGLRSVAVIPVILFHAGYSFSSGGFVGVDVFFVISGYLISSIIFGRLATGSFSIVQFYEARARRILPALFFVMAFCVPLAWILMTPRQWTEFSESMVWTTLFSSNIFFWLHSDYFASASEFKPLLHTWSLAVEEQYYVFFPLLAAALWRFGRPVLYTVLSILGIASLAWCMWLVDKSPEANFFLTPSRIWELLAGVACTAVLFHINQKNIRLANPHRQLGSALGLGLVLFSILTFDSETPFPSAWAILPILGTSLIIIFADPDTWVGKFLSLKPLVGIGLISYSAYLWHQPLFAFARIYEIGEPSQAVMVSLIIASFILAYVSWRWVEQPFRKKNTSGVVVDGKKLFAKRETIFTFAAIGMLSFISIGYIQSQNIISPSRFDLAADNLELQDLSFQKRRTLIRFGTCHFNPANTWKGNWDCDPYKQPDTNGLRPVGVATIGDSHAADKAMILRAYGLSPMQFGGAACSLHPGDRRFCKELYEFAKQQIASNNEIKEIWLANRYGKSESELSALAESIAYWKDTNKQIVLFSGMPEFKNLDENISAAAPDLPTLKPWLTAHERTTTKEVVELAHQNNVILVDTSTLVCPVLDECDFTTRTGPMIYLDDSHLTPIGAGIAGQRLLDFLNCTPAPNGTYSILASPEDCTKQP